MQTTIAEVAAALIAGIKAQYNEPYQRTAVCKLGQHLTEMAEGMRHQVDHQEQLSPAQERQFNLLQELWTQLMDQAPPR